MVNASDPNQPMTGITKISEHDIICGRGGLALKHPGNAAYRKIVTLNKELYATCLKTEKLRISKSIVAAIREINARFVEREDGKTATKLDETDEHGNPCTWRDIGDKRAIEKTSQALREGQPKLLKKLAQQGENATPLGGLAMNGNYQVMSQQFGVPLPQSMPSQGAYPLQNVAANQRPDLAGLKQDSFSLASLVGGQTFSSFPRNSFVEKGVPNTREASAASFQDSWGPSDPMPLGGAVKRNSQDSWGMVDPTPLPFQDGGAGSGRRDRR